MTELKEAARLLANLVDDMTLHVEANWRVNRHSDGPDDRPEVQYWIVASGGGESGPCEEVDEATARLVCEIIGQDLPDPNRWPGRWAEDRFTPGRVDKIVEGWT